ncbi:SDR family oxidoreductase [SAR202 cluster bacterium AD-812-D07_MRT_10900m]|nr:SDR family oxidoreductase [SAR202 cluster bacterium AD-812-D07_MRT_10900m]
MACRPESVDPSVCCQDPVDRLELLPRGFDYAVQFTGIRSSHRPLSNQQYCHFSLNTAAGTHDISRTIQPSFRRPKINWRISLPTILLTGANRGIGLELVRQYVSDGWTVIATCRDPESASDLTAISGNITIRKLDVQQYDHISQLAAEIRETPIDVLFSNGAIGAPRDPDDSSVTFGDIDVPLLLDYFRTNTIGPIKLTEAFLPNVLASVQKKIVFMSSRGASLTERGNLPHHKPGGNYSYRVSKAALNAASRSLAFDLRPQGVTVLTLNPGWVRTRMGGDDADLSVSFSVENMRRIIHSSNLEETGSFFEYDGTALSW